MNHNNQMMISAVALLAISFSSSVYPVDCAIPSSPRSREAIKRVKPTIIKELTEKHLELGAPIFFRIFKEEMALKVWMRGKREFELFKTYPICTYGIGGLGPKTKEGDGMAPEGFYVVTPSQLNPVSRFHLAFNLGYPNNYDRRHGRTGGALMIHGRCLSIGCYAMTDSAIEELYALADAAMTHGQPFFRVHIFPFRMNKTNMRTHRESRWYSFRSNLKKGYDYLQTGHRIPPNVEVRGGEYVFENP